MFIKRDLILILIWF